MFIFGGFPKVIVTMSNPTASVWEFQLFQIPHHLGFFVCLFSFLWVICTIILWFWFFWWWWLMRVNPFFIDHLDILLRDVFIKLFCPFFCWALSPSFSPSLPHPFLSFCKYFFKNLEFFYVFHPVFPILNVLHNHGRFGVQAGICFFLWNKADLQVNTYCLAFFHLDNFCVAHRNRRLDLDTFL